MIAKPLESITEVDLVQLVESGTPESKHIEYKRELPEAGERGNVKFLKSVTAFANTQGGDLIYGIEASDGTPQQLRAVAMPSSDLVLQRLESLCADGVEPRLTGLAHFRFVPLAAGGEVLVVRIAKSWNAPHRVTTGGHSHFYGRNANGTYPLDVGELRQAFTLSQSVAERIRTFRADRLMMIGSGYTPVPLVDGARVVLHVVPLQSMTTDMRVEIRGNSQALLKVSPPGASGWHSRYNLDGRLTFADAGNGKNEGYAQLFRNGIIESVGTYRAYGHDPETIIPSILYERETLEAASNFLHALKEFGITPPLYIFLSCVGVAGYSLGVDTWRYAIEGRRCADRDAIVIPELLAEEWPNEVAAFMRPAFDILWNAFGYERSLNYDSDGRWAPRGG